VKEAAHMTLWCKREDRAFKFTAKVGIPRQIDTELWESEWSLGELLVHQGVPIKNMDSMLTLLTAIRFIGKFLEGRVLEGDEFYFDEALSEKVESIAELFDFTSNTEDQTQL